MKKRVSHSDLLFFVPFIIIISAMVIAKAITTKPVIERIILLKSGLSSPPNVVSIVVSNVSIDTQAEISVIVLDAEYTGL